VVYPPVYFSFVNTIQIAEKIIPNEEVYNIFFHFIGSPPPRYASGAVISMMFLKKKSKEMNPRIIKQINI
jgi:hypothetical protein